MPRSPEAKRALYYEYRALCVKHGEASVGSDWWSHYTVLRSIAEERRLTPAELKCWWTERFTPAEIRVMGGALEFLSLSGRNGYAPHDHRTRNAVGRP